MKEKQMKPYLPEVDVEAIKTFVANRPETHTKIRLVNETIEALDRLGFADRTALFRLVGRDEYDKKLAKHGRRDV